jgi:hypothetical protein
MLERRRDESDDSVGIPTGVGAVQQSTTQVIMIDGPLVVLSVKSIKTHIDCHCLFVLFMGCLFVYLGKHEGETVYCHVSRFAAMATERLYCDSPEGMLPLNQTGLYVGLLMPMGVVLFESEVANKY